MRAMVLAAGLGTRLSPLTEELPKPAVPVANRPLIAFALEHLARSGLRDVVVNTFHLAERAAEHIRAAAPPELSLTILAEPELLGTGGGIRNAAPHLLDGDAPVLVVNSDILFAPDLRAAVAHHERLGAVATMVLRRTSDPKRFGSVDIDSAGRVRRLLGAPAEASGPLEALMFTGVHVLSPRAFAALPARGCVVRHAYRRWVDAGEVVAGFVDGSAWRDVGTLESYLAANLDLAAGRLVWPGVVPSHTGVLAAPDAVIDAAAEVRHSVIGAGATVAAGVVLDRCVVWPGTHVDCGSRDAVVTPNRIVPVC